MGEVRTLICAFLLGIGLAPAPLAAQPAAAPSAAEPAAPRVNARQLLAVVRDNLAQASQSAAVSGMERGNPRYTPFWSTYDQMAFALDRIGAAMRDRSPALLTELRSGTRSLESMSAVWRWSGRDEPAVTAALNTVVASYRLLRGQYGPEALRARQPEDLTAAERRQLQAWQRVQRRLAARLEVLEEEAGRQRQARMQEELRRIRERASRVAFAAVTLDSYLDAAESNDEVQGQWDGASYYVDPENGPIWEDTYEVVEELSVEEEDSPMVVMAANLTTGESWSFLDYETDLPVEVLPLDDVTADASNPAPIPAEPITEDDEIWAVQGLSTPHSVQAELPVMEVEEAESAEPVVETVEMIESGEPAEAIEPAETDAEVASVEDGEKAWPEHAAPEDESLTVEDIEEEEAAPKTAEKARPEEPEKKTEKAEPAAAKPTPQAKAKAKGKAKAASSKPPKKSSPPRRPSSQ